MSMRRTAHTSLLAVVLLVAAMAVFAQGRLVIDVSKSKPPALGKSVIYDEEPGSIRNSEERSFQSAQQRQSSAAAQSRVSSAPAQQRTSVGAQTRTASAASERRTGEASERHGSVRLDTIR